MTDLYEFLRGVADNNNRVWFSARRAEYDELRARWYEDLQRLINAMCSWWPEMVTQTPSSASYRFNRDTRFSQDKSPYKQFFSAALTPYGKKSSMAACYLQLDIRAEENGLYGGIYCPTSAELRKLRRAIVDNIEEFEEIIHDPELNRLYPGWLGEPLKTAPQGWPKDHPQIELLRLRYYGRFNKCSRDYFRDPQWPEITSERFRVLFPLLRFLNYSLEEE